MARRVAPSAVPTRAVSSAAVDERYYRAFVAHDARLDGRVFVGVTSTGIYCRPVCRVRTPKRGNCRFFSHAAAAEQAGFRPCLRCRPEQAPGLALVDSPATLAAEAVRIIEERAADGDLYLPDLARQLGITDRHFRRIFQAAHGVPPLGFLTTRRLLLAKQLLTDTTLPVTEVALASGFASVRRFNAAFAARYRLSPTALRRAGGGSVPEVVVIRLGYRPPYDVAGLLRFFADRALPGVEAVEATGLRRTLAVTHQGRELAGWVAVRVVPARHEVEVALAAPLLPALGLVLRRVRQAFDLDADPALVDPVLAGLPLARRAPARPGLRLPGALDPFEVAVRAILGQQVSVAAARTLAGRLVARFGTPVATPWPDLDRLFPGAATLALARPSAIAALGIVRQRAGALQSLARAVADGRVALHRGAPLQATLDALAALPGIGDWTRQLIAMRALAWSDAFPAADLGVLRALGTRDARQARVLAEAWRPWRAYAVVRLWQTQEKRPCDSPESWPRHASTRRSAR
jgi:AraC family transcriptional regulator of adaptative response / DNA-3-methyladenine glycosylase II